jgi:hypothetical protein
VENAGIPEVNGEFTFVNVKNNAGSYARSCNYKNKEVKFTLYKCSTRNGGYHWFISITPEGMAPGTSDDIDFYYCPAKIEDFAPPKHGWKKTSSTQTRDPAPEVRYVQISITIDDDSGDNEVEQAADEILERDLGGRIGDPLKHQRHTMFKEGQFSDFKLIWNAQVISVHKCILVSESGHFRDLFSGEWKTSQQGVIDIPGNEVTNKTIEAFFHFLYTNLITSADLQEGLHELHDLSIYFQVKKLTLFCEANIQKCLTAETAETFLSWRFSYPKYQKTLSNFIAASFKSLSCKNFPFHKAGKTVVTQFINKIAANVPNYDWINPDSATVLEPGIGKPLKHPHYEMYENGTYSDFKISWNGTEYALHKCVLYAESLYFQTLLASSWKESDSGEVTVPGKGITKKGFDNFLVFLYTGFILELDLKENLFELYYLSDYFQVASLKELVLKAFKKYLNDSNAEMYLENIHCCNASELKGIMAYFLASRFKQLVEKQFPFHKLGKIILSKFLQRLSVTNGTGYEPGITGTWYPPESTAVITEEDEEIEDF